MPKIYIRYKEAKAIVGSHTINKYVKRARDRRIKREGWQPDITRRHTGYK